MDLLIRYNDGPGMGSPAGVVSYFGGHLQETKEGGGLASCPGYLSRDGLVKPEAFNPDLWREVGWDPAKEELPPPELLRQLSMGYDLDGTKLTQSRALFRQPKEALITLPAEVSQALKDHPEAARDLLREVVAAHLAEVEREAVRVRVGGRVQEWRPARTLSLAYFHAENRGGEVHFHAHTLTFAPAKAEDGWRSWDNGRNVQRLSKPGGGREKATDAMLAAATKHGLEVDLRRGRASLAPGMAQGATVRGLDGQVIEAGSLDRARRVEILAAQELKRELGGIVPLTPRELEFIRRETGKLPQSLPGERRRLAMAAKLNELGMLGEDGRILPKAELAERLKGYERKLALAQVQMEAGATLPGTGEKHLEAARLIQGKREAVAAVAGAVSGAGVDLAASTKAARIRWTEDYARVLLLAHQAGEAGLRTDALNKRDRDLLSKLKGAGHLTGEIDWVMRIQGVSFRHAVERLKADLGLPSEADPVKRSHVRMLPSPVAFDAGDQALLRQVIAYYFETLKASPEALEYLRARGIAHPEAIEKFRLGYANRTLGYSLPIKQVKAGAEIRGRLEKVGLYRESGHEHFTGSLVIPVMDEAGEVQEVYGRKLLDNLRKGTPKHLYLPGPHRGVWNVEGLQGSKEIILCEALIDALTFWCAGYRNVTAAYGVEGFTADHLAAFQRYGIERVLIAYDRDEAGDRAAVTLAKKLMEHGIACYRVQFPKGMDANAYALKVAPAAKSLGLVIRGAAWMGSGQAPKRDAATIREADRAESAQPIAGAEPRGPKARAKEESIREEVVAQVQVEPASVPDALPSLAAVSQAAPEALDSVALPASPVPPAPGDALPHEVQGQDLMLALGDRAYRVRGWQKPLSPEILKINLMVSRGQNFHVDTLDLYQAKARSAFIKQASLELSESEEALKKDLGQVLRKVEAMQADQLSEALKAKEAWPELSDSEHAEALSLLKAPDLLERILRDFEGLGVVGEEANKLTGYLAAVSRLLDRPLALLIQSASAAGKSSLMDAVLDLVPEEDLVRYSAMSGQSLFYMGDKNLSHKILAIAEEEGAKQASYALKLLQSEGRVTMASTGKDPATGMLTTHDYTVEGPVMLFLTTTAIELDEELLNRCLVLTVNESREQTRAIHALQRSRETLEGLLARTERDQLIALHRNVQRLLQPLAVVNPYADQLSFRDDQTRSRRDHVKYLTLIRAIALLHQFQREVRTLPHGDRILRYIEVTPDDIRLANELAQEVFSRTVDELLPQTRKLLTLLHAWVQAECERQGVAQSDFQFTRRQAREATGWGDSQVKVHLDRLVELEFLVAHRGRQGQAFSYELLFQGEDAEGRARLLGLIDGAALQAPREGAATTTTSRGEDADFSAPFRGGLGPFSGGSRGTITPLNLSPDAALNGSPAHEAGNAYQGVSASAPSYLSVVP